jgi:hypothetical protein
VARRRRPMRWWTSSSPGTAAPQPDPYP